MSDSPFGPQGPQPPAPQAVHQTIIVNQGAAPSQALPALVNFFCFPGLGQLIQGRPLIALAWWVCHILAGISCFFLIGFVLWPIVWIACTIDAAMYNPNDQQANAKNEQTVLYGIGGLAAVMLVMFLFCAGLPLIVPRAEPIAEAPKVTIPPPSSSIPLDDDYEEPAPSISSSSSEEEQPPAMDPADDLPTFAETQAKSIADREEALRKAAEFPGSLPVNLEQQAREEAERLAAEQAAAAEAEKAAKEAARLERIEAAKWRVWSSASGSFSTEAKFLSFGAGKVTLEKKDGKVITVDLSQLSPADESFIRNKDWLKAGGE